MFISVSILQYTLMKILRQNMIQFVICFFVFQSFVLASVPKCSEVDGKYPVYFALPDCTKFCQCSNGTLYFHDCPDGLHFNSVLNVCDWPHRAGCDAAFNDGDDDKDGDNDDDNYVDNDNDYDNQKTEITTEHSEVNFCQQNGIECPEVDGKYSVYSALPDCTKFCQCSNGKPFLHKCPDGLHFNSVLNVCDWPHRAGCDSARNDTDDSDVIDDNDGGNDNDRDDHKKDNTTEPTGVNICQQNGIECPEVDGKYPVYFALPDCTKFCQCSNGKPYLQDCPDGLHFSSILNVCDWPHRAGCDSARNDTDNDKDGDDGDDNDGGNDNDYDDQKKEITTEHPGVNICQQNGIECPKVDGKYPVYFALPNCTKFCQCSNGKPYLQDCPDGLHFNSILNVCDWPHRAGCDSVRNDTDDDNDGDDSDDNDGGNDNDRDDQKKEITTEPTGVNICQQNEIECPEVDGKYPVYFALPDCTKFCQCSNGKAYLHDCPNGLHFSSILNVCDWPHRAGCGAARNDTDYDKDGDDGDDNDGGNNNDRDDQKKEITTEPTEVNICQQNGIECPKFDSKYPVYSALPDCTKFCQCSNGKPYLHGCPDGLHFNPELNVCDYPKNANCSSVIF